jgi:hypothetical protein
MAIKRKTSTIQSDCWFACSCRLLAEEDVAAGPGPISAAAGDDGAELYTAGGVEAAGFDAAKFNLYLVRKVRAAARSLHGI